MKASGCHFLFPAKRVTKEKLPAVPYPVNGLWVGRVTTAEQANAGFEESNERFISTFASSKIIIKKAPALKQRLMDCI